MCPVRSATYVSGRSKRDLQKDTILENCLWLPFGYELH
jgi:hypothetical protein